MNATIKASPGFYFTTLTIYIYIYLLYNRLTLHYLEKREKKIGKGESNTWIWWILEKKFLYPQIQGVTPTSVETEFKSYPVFSPN